MSVVERTAISVHPAPATASGVTFVDLQDETGMINVVISVGCWSKYATVARGSNALTVRGRVERAGDVTNIAADHPPTHPTRGDEALTRLPLSNWPTCKPRRSGGTSLSVRSVLPSPTENWPSPPASPTLHDKMSLSI